MILKIFSEAILQAFQQLAGNKLRTLLSLLGIMIGILCIIMVFSAVDSLEENIRSSFDKLGDDVIYVSRFPWDEDPGDKWWIYSKRPNPDYDDFMALSNKLEGYDAISYSSFIGSKTVKYREDDVSNIFVVGASHQYNQIFRLKMSEGRFFSPTESHLGSNKIVIGHEVAQALFGDAQAVGKKVKVMGRMFTIIGVIQKEGNSLINIINYDEGVIVPLNAARKMFDIKQRGASISVKAGAGLDLDQLQDQITSVLRNKRKIKPKEDSNFSLNRLTIISQALDGFFAILTIAGLIIGGFATIVGMFSVANIMFVSVKERTRIIGIKKALGAKPFIILIEFLIEAIILCLLGGLLGLGIVWALAYAVTYALDFNIFLSTKNIVLGIGLSIFIGVLAGIIPAFIASRMDPVEAMRK